MIGFSLFALITGVVAVFTLGFGPVQPFLGWTPSARIDGLFISMTASFIEDLIFFAVVGILTLLWQARTPSDDTIENRLYHYMNGTKVSSSARSHTSEYLKRLGSFSPLYKTTVTFFGEKDADLDAIKITADLERSLVNMFRDEPFQDPDLFYQVTTDQVGSDETLQGEFLSAKIIRNGLIDEIVPAPMPIRGAGIKENVELTIDPDGEASFLHRYWVWYRIGAQFFINHGRYTEKVDLRLVNKTLHMIVLDIEGEAGLRRLPPGGVHTMSHKGVEMGAQVLFALKGVEK